MIKNQVKIFISYAWENELHNDKVISFCDSLRKDFGYNAEMDKSLSQQQSAIHFTEMMYERIANSNKVIIVLSPKYKERADAFTGGVGEEYRLIITDISKNIDKYILVSFDGINDEWIPFGLGGRNIIDFSHSLDEAFNKLNSKIKNEPEIDFSEVSKEIPSVKKKEIRNFKEIINEKNFQERLENEAIPNIPKINFIENQEEITKYSKIFQLVCFYKSEHILKYSILGKSIILGLDVIYDKEEFKSQLRVTILLNKGGWNIQKTIIIENEESYCSFDKEDFRIIDNQILIVYQTSSVGTAYNGMQTYNFCLFDLIDNSYEVIKYFYVSGSFVGEYINIDEISEETQKITLPYIVSFLENIGIGKDDDINENSFPHIQWIVNNPAIHDDINNYKNHYGDFRINFTPIDISFIPKLSEFEGDIEAYESNVSIIESDNFIVYGGFASQIIGLNKSVSRSFIVFVPEGYPAGGGWGARSFELLSLNDDILIIQDMLYKLTINLSDGYFNVEDSNSLDDIGISTNGENNLKDFVKNIFRKILQ